MDSNLETIAVLKLIDVLTKLTERLGVPTPPAGSKSDPRVIKSTDSAGSTGLGSNPFGILGVDSEQILELSTNLGLSVPGLLAFKDLDWQMLSVAAEYLEEFLLDLTMMDQDVKYAITVTDGINTIIKTLTSLSSMGAMVSLVTWGALGLAAIPIGLIVLGLAALAPISPAVLAGLATVEAVIHAFMWNAAMGVVLIAGLGGALIIFSLGLVELASAMTQLGSIPWGTLGEAGLIIGVILGVVIGLGVPVVAGLAGLGLLVIVGIAATLGILGFVLSKLSELDLEGLPTVGTNISQFLSNLVGELDLAEGAGLLLMAPMLLVLCGGLVVLFKTISGIPDTSNLPAVGSNINGLLRNLIANLSIAKGIGLFLIPDAIKDIGGAIKTIAGATTTIPTEHIKFLTDFMSIDTGKLEDVSVKVAESLSTVSKSVRDIGDSINQVSFAKLALLATNLGKVVMSVNAFSPEMTKTNAILTEQLSIQKQQLAELQAHSGLLSNLKVGGGGGSVAPSATLGKPDSFADARQAFRASAYYT
jgi:hypothetical protein